MLLEHCAIGVLGRALDHLMLGIVVIIEYPANCLLLFATAAFGCTCCAFALIRIGSQ